MELQSGFYGLGIAPNILAVIERLNFKTPTPIQQKSIPPALEGKDLIGIAQTGTGKTLAFGVPMVQAALRGTRGLVVLPTRELALQVQETIEKLGGALRVRTVLLIGGESIGRQITALRRDPLIVIGTPGRILDHLNQRTVSLSAVGMLVLDEADRMLDMGFAPQLNRILAAVPKERQTMLFSATMPQDIVNIAKANMKLPLRVEIAPPGTTVAKVTQELFVVSRPDKARLLEKVLEEYRGSVLVFSRTKFGAKKIAASVRAMGHPAAELHANRSLSQRREALDGFRNGKYRVLIATDIAARGIDVKGIEVVVNYDLPSTAEDYVHRIGRTARAGGKGHAISFATPDQRGDVRGIERLIRQVLPLSKLPALPPHRSAPVMDHDSYEPRRPSRFQSSRPYAPRTRSAGPRRFQTRRKFR
ncbi:MAG: DEAD/DEAH box helicase [Candidatus Brennerbacteria bacterium]|nr:DEAD/DEAH box helicase [Candidatus Brennerbacteria bacterium]